MSNFKLEDSWLLLAVKYAQGEKESATKEEVIEAGDFINHAIFMNEEIEHGIRVLTPPCLLEVKGEAFKLGSKFSELWEKSGAEQHRGVHKQLEKLQYAMGIA